MQRLPHAATPPVRSDDALFWHHLADRCLAGEPTTRDEALAALRAPDDQLLALLDAAWRIRRHHWGDRVLLHVLQNVRSGACSEDCAFCSQSRVATGPVPRTALVSHDEMLAAARQAREAGASRFCLVGAYRELAETPLDRICEAVAAIRAEVGIGVCVSAGILSSDQAERLRDAGADRYNHNLESSRRHFPKLCSTHEYDDRVRTIERAHAAGLSVCSGGLVGTGEDDEDVVEMALELRRLGVESIPINFLDPRPGTPLQDQPMVDPRRCLRVLSMVRLVNPSRDIRVAGGREVVLRSLGPMALYPCNSIFTRGYLTTGGNSDDEDLAMLTDLGMVPDPG